jgi:serine protease Do
MLESHNAVRTKSQSLFRHHRTLLTSVGVLSVAILLGGAFAYRELRLPDSISQVHADPTSVAQVQAVPVHGAESVAQPAGFAALVARVKPAVVSVRVRIDEPVQAMRMTQNGGLPFSPDIPQTHQRVSGQGSGFFISADGYAVTNYHVVDHALSVQVTTDAGKSYTAKVIGTDPKTDLALIKVDAQSLPYVSFSDQAPRIGDWVIAIGNPFGLGGTVTAGIVSAQGRDIGSGPYDYIQIDASINKGNSGGPAFDTNGNVIGVNTAIYSPSGGSVGIGFDIPAATAKTVIAQLKADGHVTRGWIGVQTQPVTVDIADSLSMQTAQGALVDEARPDSPAEKAGIKSGDVITAIDGAGIKDSRELVQRIGGMTPGTSVALNILRDGGPNTLNLTVGTPPPEPQAQAETRASDMPANREPGLGLALAPASLAGGGNEGVVIVAVDPSGAGAEAGLEAGDVVLNVGGKVVSSPEEVNNGVAELRKEGKRTALMRVRSGESTRFVAVPLGAS